MVSFYMVLITAYLFLNNNIFWAFFIACSMNVNVLLVDNWLMTYKPQFNFFSLAAMQFIPLLTMYESGLNFMATISIIGCPIFDGNSWDYSPHHIDDLFTFCQSIGVYNILNSYHLFPHSLHGKEKDWYKSITPNPNFVRENIFIKKIIDFPPPPNHFEFFLELLCDFC